MDVDGFGDDTWFGEDGYFHTDAMHVVERDAPRLLNDDHHFSAEPGIRTRT